jgi:hypothetical protein
VEKVMKKNDLKKKPDCKLNKNFKNITETYFMLLLPSQVCIIHRKNKFDIAKACNIPIQDYENHTDITCDSTVNFF